MKKNSFLRLINALACGAVLFNLPSQLQAQTHPIGVLGQPRGPIQYNSLYKGPIGPAAMSHRAPRYMSYMPVHSNPISGRVVPSYSVLSGLLNCPTPDRGVYFAGPRRSCILTPWFRPQPYWTNRGTIDSEGAPVTKAPSQSKKSKKKNAAPKPKQPVEPSAEKSKEPSTDAATEPSTDAATASPSADQSAAAPSKTTSKVTGAGPESQTQEAQAAASQQEAASTQANSNPSTKSDAKTDAAVQTGQADRATAAEVDPKTASPTAIANQTQDAENAGLEQEATSPAQGNGPQTAGANKPSATENSAADASSNANEIANANTPATALPEETNSIQMDVPSQTPANSTADRSPDVVQQTPAIAGQATTANQFATENPSAIDNVDAVDSASAAALATSSLSAQPNSDTIGAAATVGVASAAAIATSALQPKDAATEVAKLSGDSVATPVTSEAKSEPTPTLAQQINQRRVQRDRAIVRSETRIRADHQRKIEQLIEEGGKDRSKEIMAIVVEMTKEVRINEQSLSERFLKDVEQLKSAIKESTK